MYLKSCTLITLRDLIIVTERLMNGTQTIIDIGVTKQQSIQVNV